MPERPHTTRDRLNENITHTAAQPICTIAGSPSATIMTSCAACAAGAMAMAKEAAPAGKVKQQQKRQQKVNTASYCSATADGWEAARDTAAWSF